MDKRKTKQAGSDITLTRKIEAPPEVVFEVWVNSRHLCKWWGPAGFSSPRCDIDPRPGGAIRIDMEAPNGTIYPMNGFFEEVVVPEKLVFTTNGIDSLDHSLFEVLNTVTFSGDRETTLTLQTHILKKTEESMPYVEILETGWKESLERLDSYVTGLMLRRAG